MHKVIALCVLCAAATASAEKVASEELLQQDVPRAPRVIAPAFTAVPPAPAIAMLGERSKGTYTCTGRVGSTPLHATLTIQLELGGAWIHTRLHQPHGISLDEYRSFDAIAKQWTRIIVTSTGQRVIQTSLGDGAGQWAWQGPVRDHEQRDPDRDVLRSASWLGQIEVTCRR